MGDPDNEIGNYSSKQLVSWWEVRDSENMCEDRPAQFWEVKQGIMEEMTFKMRSEWQGKR